MGYIWVILGWIWAFCNAVDPMPISPSPSHHLFSGWCNHPQNPSCLWPWAFRHCIIIASYCRSPTSSTHRMCTSVYIITYVTVIPTLRASSIVFLMFVIPIISHYIPLWTFINHKIIQLTYPIADSNSHIGQGPRPRVARCGLRGPSGGFWGDAGSKQHGRMKPTKMGKNRGIWRTNHVKYEVLEVNHLYHGKWNRGFLQWLVVDPEIKGGWLGNAPF